MLAGRSEPRPPCARGRATVCHGMPVCCRGRRRRSCSQPQRPIPRAAMRTGTAAPLGWHAGLGPTPPAVRLKAAFWKLRGGLARTYAARYHHGVHAKQTGRIRATIVSTAFQRMSFSPGAHAVRGPSSAGGAHGVVGEAGRAGRVGHARALPAGHARRAVAHVAVAQRRQLRLRAAATVPVACTRTNGINISQSLCGALSLCINCMARQLRPHAWLRACMSSKLRNKKAVCDVSPCPAHHDWPTSDWLWLDRLRLEVCDTRGRRGQRAAAPA